MEDSSPNENNEPSMPPISALVSSVTPFFHSSSPSNVIKGVVSGLGTVSMSAVGSLVMIIGVPIKGGQIGYASYGVCGAVGGGVAGVLAGGLGAAAVTVYGTCSCLYSVSVGLYRTPFAIHAAANGKTWDDDAKEWFSYDLKVESSNLLNLNDTDFTNALKVPGAKASQFFKRSNVAGGPLLLGDTASSESGESDGQKPKAKKNVLDRELYDALGIEPEATSSEIKKAYYTKARLCHPDRHPDDPAAKARFQIVGDAYQILADPKLRLAYDTKGRPAVEGQKTFDAAMIYTIIFGSEDFEHIIGELEIATQIKALNPDDMQGDITSNLFRFKQRKRELQCAVLLAAKLDVFAVDGDEDVFLEKATSEAKSLAETKLGCTLLGVIGSVYCEKAKARLSSISYIGAKLSRFATGLSRSISCVSYFVGTAYGAYKMSEVKKAAEDRQRAEDLVNNISEDERKRLDTADAAKAGPLAFNTLYGPNPSDEQKAAARDTTKLLSSNIFGLLWEVTKADITSTLIHVCRKVLRDHSTTEGTRAKRAKALLLLGEEYRRMSVTEADGMTEFIDKMGSQTGLFGEGEVNPEEAGEEGEESNEQNEQEEKEKEKEEEEAVFPRSKADIEAAIDSISLMTVKQLKETITALGGDYSGCLEKEDLRDNLMSILKKNLSEVEEKNGNEKKMD